MNRLTVVSRIIAVFSFILVALLGIGGLSVHRIGEINDAATLVGSNVDGLAQIGSSRAAAFQSQFTLARVSSEAPGPGRDALLAEAASEMAAALAEWKKYDLTCDPGEERADADKVNALLAPYLEAVNGLHGDALTEVSLKSTLELGAAVTSAMQANNEYQIKQARGATADASSLAASSSVMLEVVLGVVGVVSLALVALLLTSIVGPIKALTTMMNKLAQNDTKVAVPGVERGDELGAMAKAVLVFKNAAIENARLGAEAAENAARAEGERGRNEQAQHTAIEQERAVVAASIGAALSKLAAKDLTYRMPSDIPDAYRKLQADFNEAIGELEEAMRSVTGSTDAIQSGTREISTASDDLSRRTEQQAANLEETAAALDEITATVNKSAEGATHARQVVAAADEDAKKTTAVVREAVEAMAAIAKSSQQITQIIGVIDEIAFQTNLLALNAGVEAARAGDAGRGFAVVASEVRALAQRSAEAAKEIKGLISTSTTQVDQGVKLVAETGKSLERIMAQVTEINEVVTSIAAGAKEQATALQEVNSAINQMDQATQKNAAMVEESKAAGHSLSEETAQLSGLVGQFQIGRANGDDTIRRELEKVAPHAFRQPAKGPTPKDPRAETRRAAPARVAVKAVANRAPAGGDADGWEEF